MLNTCLKRKKKQAQYETLISMNSSATRIIYQAISKNTGTFESK